MYVKVWGFLIIFVTVTIRVRFDLIWQIFNSKYINI